MSSKNQTEPNTTPGPVPLPPNRRASFSQNPSFQTLFGGQRSSPPKAAPDPSLTRRFSWSWAPPPQKESSSAIDDSDDLVSSPLEDQRRGSEIGRRLSSTASTLREALGLKFDEPPSPGTGRTVSFPFTVVWKCVDNGLGPLSAEETIWTGYQSYCSSWRYVSFFSLVFGEELLMSRWSTIFHATKESKFRENAKGSRSPCRQNVAGTLLSRLTK